MTEAGWEKLGVVATLGMCVLLMFLLGAGVWLFLSL